jgi:predicted nucleic acid-binding protein
MTELQQAALDTSFWVVGHRADVLPYLFEFFAVHLPPAVRAEITAVEPRYPRRRYGYAALFRVLEECGLFTAAAPVQVESRYRRGEAEAIVLATERGMTVLINDRRPLAYARSLGVTCISVADFIVYLYERERLSRASAEVKLGLIEPFTSPSVLAPARVVMAALVRARGEEGI